MKNSITTPFYHQRPKAAKEADNKGEKISTINIAKPGGGDGNDIPLKNAGVEPNGKRLVLERKPTTSTEDINASAEAFIKNFKQQLLLQRLESIENYEQMLQRGT